jgi:hypothetical protein
MQLRQQKKMISREWSELSELPPSRERKELPSAEKNADDVEHVDTSAYDDWVNLEAVKEEYLGESWKRRRSFLFSARRGVRALEANASILTKES